MDVDRASQGDAVDRQLLLVDAIGRETGEQNSDQCEEADDEAQPNHSVTRRWEGGEDEQGASDVCGGGRKSETE